MRFGSWNIRRFPVKAGGDSKAAAGGGRDGSADRRWPTGGVETIVIGGIELAVRETRTVGIGPESLRRAGVSTGSILTVRARADGAAT
jgi:hypothetical protein